MKRPLVACAALSGAALLACVLPDRGIMIIDEQVQNKHPVRFVEPTPVTNEAANQCLNAIKKYQTRVCQPSDPATALPLFLDPGLQDDNGKFPYRFCACGVQESDTLRLPAVTLYVEDRADDVDDGLDPIYAALQLDLRPDDSQPQRTVEYLAYVDPSVGLPESLLDYAPPNRPNKASGRGLRELNLGNAEPSQRIDLCNGAGTTALTRGFHTLRVIVTDAPWFKPDDDDGLGTQVQQFGVPDLTNGATYDTITYVFHCDDKTSDLDNFCDEQCQVSQ